MQIFCCFVVGLVCCFNRSYYLFFSSPDFAWAFTFQVGDNSSKIDGENFLGWFYFFVVVALVCACLLIV